MKVSVSNVVAVVLALMVGRYWGQPEAPPAEVITRVDTVAPAALLAMIESGALENAGLRAKLAGRGGVAPREIIRTDTLVLPPDTVLQLVRVEGESLTTAPLIKADSGYTPELHRYDIGACDDAWSWANGELVCDRARLGHIALLLSAGVTYPIWGGSYPSWESSAGLEWTPSHRNPWRASLAMDQRGRLVATVARGWRIF